ncbi:MAG TPA: tRNA uridine-5-carboxymethylaminomethyl(34) synthesis GTPase MnmE [Candidatus Eisenbacteria bacterium]|nr:tRNA uridine-5-carboxymethylaminomethyl(34) synthesis GTPase MnmE [Candidatus Eisenbacteria bacterium]
MIRTDDTIAALATAPGAAGLAVVRVSGRDALAIADAVFRGRAPLACAASHTLHHGLARAADGAPLDEVVAAVFRAPRSYTREDVVELSCHGGGSGSRVLDALRAAGARTAGPGEFTLRAFLNGRIDLAQAEAVADVVRAESDAARALALAQLAGALSRRLDALAESLADAAAEIEARVDFAEDVGGVEVPERIVQAIARARDALEHLLAGSAWARAVRAGARVAIAGAPNAGKSSLFNALLGEARAIVSERPGTTRDVVSEAFELAGVRVTLSDTAGVRTGAGAIESLGIARAHAALDASVVVLWVVDASRPLDPDALGPIAARAGAAIVVLNKCDRRSRIADDEVRVRAGADVPLVRTSATRGTGLEALRAALATRLGGGAGAHGGGAVANGGAGAQRHGAGADARPHAIAAAVSNPRHIEALERARAALERAANVAAGGSPGEIVALELRDALGAIGEVTGRNLADDLLERIFSRFCIGK